MITQDQLKSVCNYDPNTGVFRWSKNRGGHVKAGKAFGTPNNERYLSVKLFGKTMKLHRLAWLYMYGEFPKGVIDHINMDRSDNRISNLRDCTRSENGQNQRAAHANNSSGVLGVYPVSGCKNERWKSHIRINGKTIYIGCFKTIDEAHAAYVSKKRELHPYGMI